MNRPESKAPEKVEAKAAAADLKAQRAAIKAARADRSDLEDHCYEALDAVRVPNVDGSGKSLDQLREETGLTLPDLSAALDQLEGQNLVERAVHAPSETLVYRARPGIPATPALVISPAAPVVP